MLTALAGVWAGQAHIHYVSLVKIVDHRHDLLCRDLFDIRKLPRFVEKRFGRSLESEHQFKLASRIGWNLV